MQRFTISLADELAHQFDHFIEAKGYGNRSEAVRDLIRERLGGARLADDHPAEAAAWCVANVSYVYDHHKQAVTLRLLDLQHDQHDLVVTSSHTHLDHDHCMETVVLRGPTAAVTAFAEQLVALRGVHHGNIHIIALGASTVPHRHRPGAGTPHVHLKPMD